MPLERFASPTCVECEARAPKTDTMHTLIQRLGWRLSRAGSADEGKTKTEWRCPSCWTNHKGSTQRGPTTSIPGKPTSPGK